MKTTNLISLLLVPITLISGTSRNSPGVLATQVCYSPDGTPKSPLPMSIYIDHMPGNTIWLPVVDKPGVSCVGVCAEGRFTYAAMKHQAGAPAECFCAEPPGHGAASGQKLTHLSHEFQLVSVPKILDETQHTANYPTTEAFQLGPGLIRYVINGEPQPIRFLPAKITGELRFPADSQGAAGCVGSCLQLHYNVAGLDGTKCVCAELAKTKLTGQYTPDSGQISAVDIDKFVPKPVTSEGVIILMPVIPNTKYVRLSFNNAPAATWFTSPGTLPPGDWHPIPATKMKLSDWQNLPGSENFDACINKCAKKHKKHAALLWVKTGYKCMCGEAQFNVKSTPLLTTYPWVPGAWQVVDVTPAHKMTPLDTVSVTDEKGREIGRVSAKEISNHYIQVSIKKPGSQPALPLQSVYSTSLPSGLVWLKQSFSTGGDTRIQCVASCYRMRFGAAAVNVGGKCYCADVSTGQLKPASSPPSAAGMIQIFLLPDRPKTSQPPQGGTVSTVTLYAIATPMSANVFRLIINDVKMRPQFASTSSLKAAKGVAFKAGIYAGQPSPTTCVVQCWKLNFPLVTMVGSFCKCMEEGAVSLSTSYSRGLVSVYNIKQFFAGVNTANDIVYRSPRVPGTQYARFIINNVACQSWLYTTRNAQSKWWRIPGYISFGMCVKTCVKMHKTYAALQWYDGKSFSCMCGDGDMKHQEQNVLYPSTPGLWQIVDISPAITTMPLVTMKVSDSLGHYLGQFSGDWISNGYIRFTAQLAKSPTTTVLNMAYSRSLPSGVMWLEYAFPAGKESKIQCVGTCYMLQFSAAAVRSDGRCFCADIHTGQFKPRASPPSTSGMVQIVILPLYPKKIPSKPIGKKLITSGAMMTSTIFRLLINGVHLTPKFASPNDISEAMASAGVSFQAQFQANGMPCSSSCTARCWSMGFPLVTVLGGQCKCMENNIRLTIHYRDGLVTVYDISAWLVKTPSNGGSVIANVPYTTHLRILINNRVIPSGFVPMSSVKYWIRRKKNSAAECLNECKRHSSKYAALINHPGAFHWVDCRCSKRLSRLSCRFRKTYPNKPGWAQAVDMKHF